MIHAKYCQMPTSCPCDINLSLLCLNLMYDCPYLLTLFIAIVSTKSTTTLWCTENHSHLIGPL